MSGEVGEPPGTVGLDEVVVRGVPLPSPSVANTGPVAVPVRATFWGYGCGDEPLPWLLSQTESLLKVRRRALPEPMTFLLSGRDMYG